ncbi:MAG: formamidopyrimidine-DNA glycosylase [Planctomycetes bacterium]|nr:formamidopyrimidine-DNA glycosylase [Planctomycetota bacterium]
MPELPDVTVYQERLRAFLVGQTLQGIRLKSSFLLRTVAPPLEAAIGRPIVAVHRIGKRLALEVDGELLLVLHLMIAGRLRWKPVAHPVADRAVLAAFDFAPGCLLLTEQGSKKRASLHVVQGRAALAQFDRGGLEPLTATGPLFAAALRRENRTLKRALTDPRLFSGIGNAYSDEILHAARLSPVLLTSRLTDEQCERLRLATAATLQHWIDRLRATVGDGFPDKVTAFLPDMAVHGKAGQPCPCCAAPVQRIRYADNECNYCARCQCGGKLLADRGLSPLLKRDWPKTLEELEELRRPG